MAQDRLIPISVELIRPSRWQPRMTFDPERLWELALSIQENGIINAPIVFPIGTDGELHKSSSRPPLYELVAGERRTRAAAAVAWAQLGNADLKEAVVGLAERGFHPLPEEARSMLAHGGFRLLCRVQTGLELPQLHRLVVVENMERENLTPLEEARALLDLQREHEWSGRELARRIGRSQGYVQQRLALLDLVPTVQYAVNTRVVTPTHARAIAQVPRPLQRALTDWAISSPEGGATASTRRVEQASREISRLVDPARWEPDAGSIYRPAERNLLALVRWALRRANLELCAERLLGLRDREAREGGNLLARRPLTIIGDSRHLNALLDALTLPPADETWSRFARETGRTCEECVFKDHPCPIEEPWSGIDVPCRRWLSPVAETCSNYVGHNDPVVIPVDWRVLQVAQEAGLVVVEEPFRHLVSPAGAVVAYRSTAERACRRPEKAEHGATTPYLEEMQAFHEWQGGLPRHSLRHPLSHACSKCAFHLAAGNPPCYFAREPLLERQGSPNARPPDFRVFVSRTGIVLPRCEMFRSREMPPLYTQDGTAFTDRDQVLAWLEALIGRRGSYQRHRNGVYGALSWIDYDRTPGQTMDVERLLRWLKENWDAIGGDPVFPTLIDVVIAESFPASQSQHGHTVHLVNPATDEEEVYAVVDFGCFCGAREGPSRQSWPRNWPRPWEPAAYDRPAWQTS